MKIKQNLSLKNRYLLWCVNIRSLYIYSAPVIMTQIKSTIEKFKNNWKISFKNMLSLPKNSANSVVELIFEDLNTNIRFSDAKV